MTHRQSTRRNRRPRLGLDRLDERIMPSVTVTANQRGAEIAIVSNSASGDGDAVSAEYANGRQLLKITDGSGQSSTFLANRVRRIVFVGGEGNDRFENKTSLISIVQGNGGNDTLVGGEGIDVLNGGNGDDVLYASAGDDPLFGGPGHDLLHRGGRRAVFHDPWPPEDMIVGLVDGPQTAAELQTKGRVTVSLDGRMLTLSGPTGAGFQLEGHWLVQPAGADLYYWAFGEVILKSAAGDISLGSAGFTIIADPTVVPGVGTLRSAVLDNILPLDTTNVTNPISDAAKKAGLTINLPGLNYGIATGEQIRAIDAKAPLADGVPYLYAIGTTGLIEYKGAQYSGLSLTAAIDPTDPAVYFGIDGVPTIERIAIGTSNRGQLAYRAKNLPDGVAAPALFGNLYMSAAVSLASMGIPFTIAGEQVIDFDANNDGRAAGIDFNNLAGLTADAKSIANLLGRAVNDVAVGVNGSITAGLKGNFSIDIGNGSAFYLANGQVAFRGSASNPFRGIGLDFLAPTTAGDVQGTFNRRNRAWSFRADIANSGIAGLNSQNVHIEGSSAAASVSFTASVKNIAGFGNVQVSGRAGFNGTLNLRGQAWISRRVDFVGGYFGADIRGTVWFNRRVGGELQTGARVEAGLIGNFLGFSVNAGLYVEVQLLEQGELLFRGSGKLNGGLWLGRTKLYGGKFADVNVDLGRISIVMPPGIPDLRINW